MLFSALAAAGIAMRLYALVTIPLERLIELWVTDDAFYYFVTAENWAKGFPSTFDREHFTNGYHPLWMMLSVAVFKIAGGAGPASVKFMLFLSILFQGVTAVLIVILGRRLLRNDLAACLAGGIYLIAPMSFILAFSGLETALAAMILTGFFAASLRAWDEKLFRWQSAMACGALAGLAFLARTDQVFYLIGAWGVMFLAGPGRARLWIIFTGLAALAVVAPWLFWNLAKTGHIMQASASAYPMLLIQHAGVYLASIGQDNTFANRFPYLVPKLFSVLKFNVPAVMMDHRVFWGALAGTMFIGLIVRNNSSSSSSRSRAHLLLIPLIGILALAVTHGMIRGYPRDWYFAGAAVIGSLAAGQMLLIWQRAFRAPWLPFLLLIIVMQYGFYDKYDQMMKGFYINQGFHRQAALWANGNLPPGARIGAFNAGVFNYYCERPVINLDGTTNNDVLPALANRTMWSYIQSEKIDYLIDAKFSVEVDYPVVMDVAGYPTVYSNACIESSTSIPILSFMFIG